MPIGMGGYGNDFAMLARFWPPSVKRGLSLDSRFNALAKNLR
ncbi:hypothetical protein Z947_3931 [Sulfitobacter geojensis]|jgi:hypothetical protein|nr:hypothetical protein Z947_3931 [Sulfitobacter geojensis]